jgi:hypothetical protein
MLYPTDGRVEAAADVVFGFLSKQPNIRLPNKRQSTLLARLLLRHLYFNTSGESYAPGAIELNGNRAPETEIRWCHHCRAKRPTTYDRLALRCQVCDFATMSLKKPIRELPA